MTRKQDAQSIATSRILSRLTEWASQAPEGAIPVPRLIALLRLRLGMTQAQLAKRCGLPQSHIAKIESGKVDVQLATLQRIFKALFCQLTLAPRPDGNLDQILRAQARKAALIRVKRVAGTMAMEDQRPEAGLLEDLVQAESERLLKKRSSEIWDV